MAGNGDQVNRGLWAKVNSSFADAVQIRERTDAWVTDRSRQIGNTLALLRRLCLGWLKRKEPGGRLELSHPTRRWEPRSLHALIKNPQTHPMNQTRHQFSRAGSNPTRSPLSALPMDIRA